MDLATFALTCIMFGMVLVRILHTLPPSKRP